MPDITSFINQINSAVRGEDVRDAIVSCLEVLNSTNSNAYTLNGHPASYFATQDDIDRILPLDEEPIENSDRGVTSGGLYTYMNKISEALDTINGEVI